MLKKKKWRFKIKQICWFLFNGSNLLDLRSHKGIFKHRFKTLKIFQNKSKILIKALMNRKVEIQEIEEKQKYNILMMKKQQQFKVS